MRWIDTTEKFSHPPIVVGSRRVWRDLFDHASLAHELHRKVDRWRIEKLVNFPLSQINNIFFQQSPMTVLTFSAEIMSPRSEKSSKRTRKTWPTTRIRSFNFKKSSKVFIMAWLSEPSKQPRQLKKNFSRNLMNWRTP